MLFRLGSRGVPIVLSAVLAMATVTGISPARPEGVDDARAGARPKLAPIPPAKSLGLPAPASTHCPWGCPRGTAAGNRLIHRQSYVLSNNRHTKFADWVAYTVEPGRFGSKRDRRWRADPDLPASETLEPEDYAGAHAVLTTDRGHQLPLASIAGAEDWRFSNYLSNVTPQKSALNRGAWARLESAVRSASRSPDIKAVYVMTGPLYERRMPKLPGADEAHRIPSGYWKLVARHVSTGVEVIGFVMDQDLAREADFCAAVIRTGLSELETRTGLRFFPGLGRTSPTARAVGGTLEKSLGCGP